MSAQIIDGKAFAASLRERVGGHAATFAETAGRKPGLAVVLVGEDPASQVYVGAKGKATLAANMESFEHRLPADTSQDDLIALVEPGSCFAGALLELALACDRQYMLDGTIEGDEQGDEAQIMLTASNFGTFPMPNGPSRLASRFHGDDDHVATLRKEVGRRLTAGEALELGLVTDAPDDIDWDDEVRIMLEERASLSRRGKISVTLDAFVMERPFGSYELFGGGERAILRRKIAAPVRRPRRGPRPAAARSSPCARWHAARRNARHG